MSHGLTSDHRSCLSQKSFTTSFSNGVSISVHGTDQALAIVSGGKTIGTLRVAEGNISSSNGVVYIKSQTLKKAA